jgi:Putative DNA-binding domain
MGRAEDLFERIRNEGESAIDFFIETQQSEELFLDFKRSADNGAGRKLHDNDRQNLSKAISGFGNSEGGIIVWGIECSSNAITGDVPSAKFPLEKPKRFVSWLEGAVSGCTVPPHPRVSHIAIDARDNNDVGYVVTLIPKSAHAPHQCLKPMQYYIRAGSNFVPTPHAVLAGMFGRRPQTSIYHLWAVHPATMLSGTQSRFAIDFDLGLNLATYGPGLARDIYVNLRLSPPKGGSSGGVRISDQANWRGYQSFGFIYSFISNTDFRLSSGMVAHPLTMTLNLQEPFESDMYYQITFGHAESSVYIIESRTSPEALEKALRKFIYARDRYEGSKQVISEIMGLDRSTTPYIQKDESYYIDIT